ncbi:major capsid protein [Sigmofec virus UA08Rod_5838]|uniref:Major capsid protein n=1 Tax=Sigmofec virus UA08Rod_5838 TaxID=2929442 RepID=A0A976R7Y6_9VIRU|nr:major capsid protein [Sigmofec virus UA08Rod_5838]
MANYKQISSANSGVHFGAALFGDVERSTMTAVSQHLTSFNAGDIVPIYCREILPQEELSLDVDFVVRQTTLLTPTMGSMHIDVFAFFVPNRIVNSSWKAVQGENYSGSWTANPVSLAPLVTSSEGSVQIPVGSVADYYGFPTQKPIPNSVLSLCHDLKFRGYVAIYNEFFRDQNYQPPIPISYLNVYQGFLDPVDANIGLAGSSNSGYVSITIPNPQVGDGSFGAGSVVDALFGSGAPSGSSTIAPRSSVNSFRATMPPLKANKLHDYFTSVLPSPQKSQKTVFAPVSGNVGSLPVVTSQNEYIVSNPVPIKARSNNGTLVSGNLGLVNGAVVGSGAEPSNFFGVNFTNLVTAGSVNVEGLALSVDDIRMASAIQRVYETLARGGSRYREIVASFFGVDVEDPFDDVPKCLGKISRDLDLYQTAQTSSSESGNTPQGNLAAFGYTSSDGHLFSHTFLEHGYVHVFAVVRHKNVYPSYFARDNFRLNMLDFYTPPLANISEQPVYTREINPFAADPNAGFGFQEAWAEYRFEPDLVSGLMRPGVEGSLSIWNYADDFDSGLQISDGNWLKSNSQQVLDRTLAVTSSVAPQLKGQFKFTALKTLPMPTYSVPGADII